MPPCILFRLPASPVFYYVDLTVSWLLYIKPEQWEWSSALTAPLNQSRPRANPEKNGLQPPRVKPEELQGAGKGGSSLSPESEGS